MKRLFVCLLAVLLALPAAAEEPARATGYATPILNGLSAVHEDDCTGYMNAWGEMVIPLTACSWYEDVTEDGYVYLRDLNSKWGVYDPWGELIVPFDCEYAWAPCEGLLRVQRDGLVGFVNTRGETVLPCQWLAAQDFCGGAAMVCDGEGWYMIDVRGQALLPDRWDAVDRSVWSDWGPTVRGDLLHEADGCARGDMWVVERDGRKGLVSAQGRVLLDCEYDSIRLDGTGHAIVGLDGLYAAVNSRGRFLCGFEWTDMSGFSEGMAWVVRDGKYGFINEMGSLAIPCEWEDACVFTQGLAPVKSGGKWGYIDSAGRLAIPCEWDSVDAFVDGVAIVGSGRLDGVIDRTGRVLCEPRWGYINAFSEGLAVVEHDGLSGVIDRAGNVVCEPEWDYIFDFSEGLAAVCDGEKWGYINARGEEAIPCQWDSALSFSGGTAVVFTDCEAREGLGVINMHGEYIVPPLFYWNADYHEGYREGCFINNAGGEIHIYDAHGNRIY